MEPICPLYVSAHLCSLYPVLLSLLRLSPQYSGLIAVGPRISLDLIQTLFAIHPPPHSFKPRLLIPSHQRFQSISAVH